MIKLYKIILLTAMCLATAFAAAQTPARKLLLVFANEIPATATPAQKQAAFKHNATVLQRRAKLLGVEQVQIWQQQPDQIGIALPDTVNAKDARALLADHILLTFHLVNDNSAKRPGKTPGYLALPDRTDGVILIKQKAFLDSHAVINAESGHDQFGGASIDIELDRAGGKVFAKATKDNIGHRIAVVLNRDGKQSVLTAPRITMEITGGRVQISGSMSTQEATAIASMLDSGTYAPPLRFVSTSYGLVPTDATSVGPVTRNY